MTVEVLTANQPETFHRGAGRIARIPQHPRSARPARGLSGLDDHPVRAGLPKAADEFFAASRLHGGDRLAQGFSVLVVVAGEGRPTAEKDDLLLRRGDTLLVPYAAGPLRMDGQIEVIRLAAPGP